MNRIDLKQTGGFKAGTNLALSSVPKPVLKPNEVLIQIASSGVNPVDWKMAEMGFMLPSEMPASLGCDVAGTVIAPEDSPLLGKRVVTYLGADKSKSGTSRPAFADHVAAENDVVFEIPGTMSFSEAASLPVGGLTALLLLNAVQKTAQPGEWLLVWGASSSVGFCGVQLAAERGYMVIAVASSTHESILKEVGASAFVDYRGGHVFEQVSEIVRNSDKPLNGAIDCIGNTDSFSTSADIVHSLGVADERVVSSTSFMLPDPPKGVVKVPVSLGSALDNNRDLIIKGMPKVLQIKPQKLRVIEGSVVPETVERAFQTNKDGVSGEKVVVEWTK